MDEPHGEWRTRNVGRLLLCSTDAFIADKFRDMHSDGLGGVSRNHLALIQNIDFDGTRLTLAAARARMTKQSMLAIAHRAELLGLVERRPDSRDGRAKVIAFTDAGLQMMERLKAGIAQAEWHMTAIVGADVMARLRKKLTDYVGLSDEVASGPPMDGADIAWRTHNMGRLLSSAFRSFTLDVQRALHGSGFPDVSEVHMTLFRNLDMEGTRPGDLAVRARMTKQAMTDLVRRTALLGLIERRTDPEDGRAQIIVLTSRGARLMEKTQLGIERAELHMADLVGTGFVTEIKRTLPAYVNVVQAPSYLAAEVTKLAQAEAPRAFQAPRSNGRRDVGQCRDPRRDPAQLADHPVGLVLAGSLRRAWGEAVDAGRVTTTGRSWPTTYSSTNRQRGSE